MDGGSLRHNAKNIAKTNAVDKTSLRESQDLILQMSHCKLKRAHAEHTDMVLQGEVVEDDEYYVELRTEKCPDMTR